MSEAGDLAARVDDHFVALLVEQSPYLDEALSSSAEAGLPPIQVSAAQGKFLHLLARAVGARRLLELGTLGGYSAIWLAAALPPGGRLVTLEADPSYAEVARINLSRAGMADRVEVVVGRAQETLQRMQVSEEFDLVFIDADKPGYPEYLELVVPLTRAGGLIVADNVVREGRVLEGASTDAGVRGVRRFCELLAQDRRLSSTVIQTVGHKGHDGFAVALVLGESA